MSDTPRSSSPEEALSHPQVIENGSVVEVDGVRQIGPIAKFSETPSVIGGRAPDLGECDSPLELVLNRPRPEALAAEDLPRHPLSGTTIIEFGYFFAMPFGLTMAAALGARVIKLEPEAGDPMRWRFAPSEIGGAKTTEAKESLAIDLRTREGMEIVRNLVRQADAFVYSFRSPPQKAGVSYEDLRKVNPDLVYLHAGGYGTHGPFARRPVYASTADSVAGYFNRCAGLWLQRETSEGMTPTELREIILPRLDFLGRGDGHGSLGVFSSLLLALLARQRFGIGQSLTTTMINSNLYSMSDDFCSYDGKAPVPMPDPELYGLHALYRLYEGSSGWIFLAAVGGNIGGVW